MLEDILWDIRYFIEDHKKGCIIFGSIFLALVVFVVTVRTINKNRKANEPQSEVSVSYDEPDEVQEDPTYQNEDYQKLLSKQDLYKSIYGDIPEGFLWDQGKVLYSQGDKSMTIEDTIFAFLSGVQTLDMLTAQRYSYSSSVVNTYQSYFAENDAKNADIATNFIRNVFREALMSIQSSTIATSSTFAENKAVVTVNAKMLDLEDKDFWLADEMSIFKNLYLYSLMDDDAKYQNFLYNYIINYYRSGKAKLKDVQFTLTLQKYPFINSGWLVSIDTDITRACTYKEGNLISKYIQKEYRDWGRDKIKEMDKEGTLDTIPTYVFGVSGEDANDESSSYYTDYNSQGGALNSDISVDSSTGTVSGDTTAGVPSMSDVSPEYDYVPNPNINSSNPMDYLQSSGSSGDVGNAGIESNGTVENSGNTIDNSISTGDDSGLNITTTDDF